MNCVFTIVAKNYLSFALTLGDSLKKQSPEVDFFIFIADDLNGVSNDLLAKHKTTIVDETIVANLKEMAFKYNVTEYSTAIKPFIFNHLFSTTNYSKIIYSDPDIYFYQSTNHIFNLLDDNFCVLTPHIIDIATAHKSEATDQGLLFAGIFNLGFIALKKTNEALNIVNWWSNRLKDFCYGDKWDNLHTDQKWIDFIPSYFTTGVHISHNKGFNIAYWNIHERDLIVENNILIINDFSKTRVTFIHFSGNNPLNPLKNKQCPKLDVTKYPIWEKYINDYAILVKLNSFTDLVKLNYTYNTFENGFTISPLHRRIFRMLLEVKTNNNFSNPFNIQEMSFYSLLQKNKLLVGVEKSAFDFAEVGEEHVRNKLARVFFLLKVLKYFVGVKKYLTFIRAFQKILRYENQVFLIKEEENLFIDDYIKKMG